jgi:glutaryl-CoA dehydrogenase
VEGQFNWEDPLRLESALSTDEVMIADAARNYCQSELMPRALEAHRNETFDREIMTELGSLGFLGSTLPEKYGCAATNFAGFRFILRS